MQKQALLLLIAFISLFPAIAQQESPRIFIDKEGIMRYADTNEEASFFGVNYTVPFAHAYRALGYLGKDRKEAIDKDVYHFARLGFNAYRIHVWDVEISDKEGRLIENDHLDLLDYLIYKLKERNIKIVITTMTNFGNGYPERNQPTDGFSYHYGKCEIHDNPQSIAAQENYISAFVNHKNNYTGQSYMDDPDIIGFEINNEPCHAGTIEQTKDYINRMLRALTQAGNEKPVFYNVSHNMQQLDAYYDTDIQGTTFQWYPIGLVAGRTRYGNFLPYVDSYSIPFNNIKGYSNKAKLVYEYDPADITYSYIHPAMVRSLRSAGFQWITQFAYDPMDMAQYNTEYQTHYLNLAYTPQKAVSMKIAAEASKVIPLFKQYGKYPNDTIFDDFRVSYALDLSELNQADKFYYSNHTTTQPIQPESLESITGYGNSPIITYEGTGIYFLDKLENGIWRLEVMPDAVPTADPFAKPSLKKEVTAIVWNKWNMRIQLPDLQDDFSVIGLNAKEEYKKQAVNGWIESIIPGVYLLKNKNSTSTKTWDADTRWKNIFLGEFAAPESSAHQYIVYHQPRQIIESNKPFTVDALIAGPEFPDSVILYSTKISFWRENNPYYKMERKQGYMYAATIPADELKSGGFEYNIVVCSNNRYYTFPAGTETHPLDWDYSSQAYRVNTVLEPDTPIVLLSISDKWDGLEMYSMPEESGEINKTILKENPLQQTFRFTFKSQAESPRFFLHKYIGDLLDGCESRLKQCKTLCVQTIEANREFQIGFVCRNGFTYTAAIQPTTNEIVRVPVSGFTQTKTALLPHSYPLFMDRYFSPDTNIPFAVEEIEKLEISLHGEKDKSERLEIGNIWLE